MAGNVPTFGSFIGGRWEEGRSYVEVHHKYTGEVLARVAEADQETVDRAVDAAERAFREQDFPPYHRYQVLKRASELLAERKEDFALRIAREGGKPLKDARAEVDRAVQTMLLSAEEAKRIGGETIPIEAAPGAEGRLAFTIRVPVGVVGAISPFNFPLNLVVHKVGPAIAAGNTVVLKPATTTPLTAVALCELMAEAGLPAGRLNLVVGPGRTVGEALLANRKIAMYTFTGSGAVGAQIKAKTGLRKVALELGNNSPNIVCADADLDDAVQILARRGFQSAGQACISVQRIYVERSVFDDFIERFKAAAAQLKVGDPEDPDTDVGPMITEDEARRAESWVREAVSQGARLIMGGQRNGAVLQPTALTDVHPDMRVVCEEVFAPVVTIMPFDTFEEALAMANDSTYGLQAGIFTSRLDRALRAARELQVGGVIINDASTFRADLMPYGGVKASGIGREGPRYAVEEMTEVRVVVMRIP